MINQPPVDLLIEQLGTDGQPVSRYCLCVDQTAGSNANSKEVLKELAIASKEIAGGKIKCVKD